MALAPNPRVLEAAEHSDSDSGLRTQPAGLWPQLYQWLSAWAWVLLLLVLVPSLGRQGQQQADLMELLKGLT